MRRIQTVIHSLGLDALGTPVVRLRTPEAWVVAPGQAILADFLGASGLLTPVFPCEIERGLLALPVDASGCPAPGARLDLFGPVGVGFQPPAAARRWLLSSTEAS
ncbi:MAG: hypothetical protein MUO23_10960, partial [Anaerolineales bacterium]|nr:hypothetical protein [Anaerolineales bacterium]